MIKKIQKYDYVFIACLLCLMVFHLCSMTTPLPYDDEALYPVVPLRFINGDIMMQHDWHLTQFSSIFSYLPVLLWVTIKGSTEGIVFFLRVCFLVIHTFSACVIYRVFRNYKYWAVIAACMYYAQTPYRMMTISYMSMMTVSFLFFTILLYRMYDKPDYKYYVVAGVLFGACCVCNPLLCFVYPFYILSCCVWYQIIKKKQLLKDSHDDKNKKINISADDVKKKVFDTYFSKKPMCLFSCGIGVMAIICIAFFFSTGATLSTFFDNFKNLIIASEYEFFDSVLLKIRQTWEAYNEISLHVPYLLPCLLILLLIDKKRKYRGHKIFYVISAFALAVLYVCGITVLFMQTIVDAYTLSLPFFIVSTVSYILTENKNKVLFYCIWLPSVICGFFQYLATGTVLTAPFVVVAIGNISGVFFIYDLLTEIKKHKKPVTKGKRNTERKETAVLSVILCAAIVLQVGFNCSLQMYNRLPGKEYSRITYGPFDGLYLDEEYYDIYEKSMADLDVIKSISNEDDPVFILSHMGWMHLYIDRPAASYCPVVFSVNSEAFKAYYEQNPEKTPKYIYVAYAYTYYVNSRQYALEDVKNLKRIFSFEAEELSAGILLKIKN